MTIASHGLKVALIRPQIPPNELSRFRMLNTSSFATFRRLVCPLVGCILLTASASPARAQHADSSLAVDANKPFAKWSESVHSVRDSLVTVARAQIGTRYVHGGTSPDGGFAIISLIVALAWTLLTSAWLASGINVEPARKATAVPAA